MAVPPIFFPFLHRTIRFRPFSGPSGLPLDKNVRPWPRPRRLSSPSVHFVESFSSSWFPSVGVCRAIRFPEEEGVRGASTSCGREGARRGGPPRRRCGRTGNELAGVEVARWGGMVLRAENEEEEDERRE